MAQLRFTVGVPGAGSAARDAESLGERFRSLRPQAGSAARQAEEERREAQRYGVSRPSATTIRMQTPSHGAEGRNAPSEAHLAAPQHQAHATQDISGSTLLPMPQQPTPNDAPAAARASAAVVATPTSLDSTPLQTAAAKFRSLFRSMLPRAAGEN